MSDYQREIIVRKGEIAQLRRLFDEYFSQKKIDGGSLYARAVLRGSTRVLRREGRPAVLIRPRVARWEIFRRDEKEPVGSVEPTRFPGGLRLIFDSFTQADFMDVYQFSENAFLQMKTLGFEPSGEKAPESRGPGRRGLDRETKVHRLALAIWAIDLKDNNPKRPWKEIVRAIGWDYGRNVHTRVKLLEGAREEVIELREEDPDGMLSEAEQLYQILKARKKRK